MSVSATPVALRFGKLPGRATWRPVDLVRSTAGPSSDSGRTGVAIAGRWSRRADQASDEALIRSLYEEHGRALLAYATRLTGDRAAAEDVVQETLVRAWRHSQSLVNEKGSVRGWLLTVARNIVTDRVRAKAARPTEVAESPATPPIERDHSESVVNSMVVLDALDKLSAEHRDVIVELYYRGRTVSEAADVLGVPAGTVKSRSYYALRAMRGVLAGRTAEAVL
jgi:RNA polymerase sigma-70 factor, ECF subfamily